MNERQRFALTHPLTNPHTDRNLMRQLQTVRRHGTGLIIMSILAVDR